MRGRFRTGCIILFLLFAGCICADSHAQAAVAQITIQQSREDIVKGDTFYVVITVRSDEEMKGFEGYFSYNQNVMQYITGGSVASGNDDEIHIKDLDREEGTTKIKYSLQFRVRKAGISSVALKRYRQITKADEDIKMSVGSASLEVEVLSRKQYNRRLEKQQKQQNLQQGGDRPEGETAGISVTAGPMETERPTVTPEASGSPEDETGRQDTFYGDGKETGAAEFPTEMPGSSDAAGTSTGHTGGVYMVILFLAMTGFVIVIGLIVGTLRSSKDIGIPEDEEEAEYDSTENEDAQEEQEQTLEEIEKRLEEKRRWLRKEQSDRRI